MSRACSLQWHSVCVIKKMQYVPDMIAIIRCCMPDVVERSVAL
jgi:hypothetical protein